MTRPHPDEILAALRDAGVNLREARRDEARAMEQVAHWAREGKDLLTVERMSQASGVPRQTITKKIKEEK
jgi:hypothetical protein